MMPMTAIIAAMAAVITTVAVSIVSMAVITVPIVAMPVITMAIKTTVIGVRIYNHGRGRRHHNGRGLVYWSWLTINRRWILIDRPLHWRRRRIYRGWLAYYY